MYAGTSAVFSFPSFFKYDTYCKLSHHYNFGGNFQFCSFQWADSNAYNICWPFFRRCCLCVSEYIKWVWRFLDFFNEKKTLFTYSWYSSLPWPWFFTRFFRLSRIFGTLSLNIFLSMQTLFLSIPNNMHNLRNALQVLPQKLILNWILNGFLLHMAV